MKTRSPTSVLVASLLILLLQTSVALSTVATNVPGKGRFYVADNGGKVWEAPGGGWKLAGIGNPRMDVILWALEQKPPELEQLKVWDVMAREPGGWLSFGIKFGRIERVVFTKDTKIILIDKEGKRYESEACLFWPDLYQTSLYDSRKSPVVVTRQSVYCRPLNGTACIKVKFAKGSFRLKDIVEFDVAGAIGDKLQRAAE